VAFSPSGRLLATPSLFGNNVAVFSVGRDGALSEVAGSPFPTGRAPAIVAFSPSGRLLATGNLGHPTLGGGDVSVFSVGRDGALTEVAGSPLATGRGTFSVSFSPSERLLAVTNRLEDSVSVFTLER
jgi:6-phosphogluconolactonase (cycloisomerase 2 family)